MLLLLSVSESFIVLCWIVGIVNETLLDRGNSHKLNGFP